MFAKPCRRRRAVRSEMECSASWDSNDYKSPVLIRGNSRLARVGCVCSFTGMTSTSKGARRLNSGIKFHCGARLGPLPTRAPDNCRPRLGAPTNPIQWKLRLPSQVVLMSTVHTLAGGNGGGAKRRRPPPLKKGYLDE
jgi:hypothetical protein